MFGLDDAMPLVSASSPRRAAGMVDLKIAPIAEYVRLLCCRSSPRKTTWVYSPANGWDCAKAAARNSGDFLPLLAVPGCYCPLLLAVRG
jgi:hypothetical protein